MAIGLVSAAFVAFVAFKGWLLKAEGARSALGMLETPCSSGLIPLVK